MVEPSLVARGLYRARFLLRCFNWQLMAKLRRHVTVTTRQGRFRVSTADDGIGGHLYKRREYESAWMAAVLRFLRERRMLPPASEGTIVDIGANLGVTSIGMLLQREFSRAIAIEPDPRNFALLKHNLELNGIEPARCACVEAAASDREGFAEFEISVANHGDHRIRPAVGVLAELAPMERLRESARRTIRVRATTMDSILSALPEAANDLALFWIDTQGHEGHVFEGGRRSFARSIPVACEIWPYGILRSGMTIQRFCEIAASLWTHYWVLRRNRIFVSYPTTILSALVEEIGTDGAFANVLLTKADMSRATTESNRELVDGAPRRPIGREPASAVSSASSREGVG